MGQLLSLQTKDGKQILRLCLDPKDLNKNISRQHYYTRTIDEILPQMHGKKYLSVADTNKGYWHVELDKESSLLCTFNTPFGRYRVKRLPFGVSVYHKTSSSVSVMKCTRTYPMSQVLQTTLSLLVQRNKSMIKHS